jgi:glycosyltransferase involved in cell wall biosynthesis
MAARRSDVIHQTACNADRSSRTPTVVTVHDCVWGAYPQANYAFQAKRICKVAFDADVVICPTEKTRRDAIKYIGLPEEKIFVAHHGITLLGKPRSQNSPVARQIAFVGLRSPLCKNFTTLLMALAQLKDVRLAVLVAGGPPKRSVPY